MKNFLFWFTVIRVTLGLAVRPEWMKNENEERENIMSFMLTKECTKKYEMRGNECDADTQ